MVVSSNKLVERLAPPVPLELLRYGLQSTLRVAGPARLRPATEASPDAGVIADYVGPLGDPAALAARLSAVPGVVEHGLFEPALVTEAMVGRGDSVERVPFPPAR